jgi:hypothetical protein
MDSLSHRTVEIPQSVLLSAHSLDDVEDWIAANDPELLNEIRRIRNEEDLAELGASDKSWKLISERRKQPTLDRSALEGKLGS